MHLRRAIGRIHYDSLGHHDFYRARDFVWVDALAQEDWNWTITRGFFLADFWTGVLVSVHVHGGPFYFAFAYCTGVLGFLRFLSRFFLCLCLWFVLSCCLFSSRLPGGGITFFAAAKKVIKESSFSSTPAAHSR
jgi:hypothetical protein